ncbi:MAG: restriction endonuclease subunit S [Deltaproteobacteria bacterium]
MKVLLKDIAIIQMGYSFRSRIQSMDSGAVAVIQMKDLTDENTVTCKNLTPTDIIKFNDSHYVKKGDLIFRSRGLSATSAIVADDPGNAVVSSPLLKVRLTNPGVMPEYLNWFISQLPAQVFLASRAGGTTQKMINKEALEALEVLVPPLEKQKAIVALAALAEEEQRIIKQLALKRKQYISATLIREAQETK